MGDDFGLGGDVELWAAFWACRRRNGQQVAGQQVADNNGSGADDEEQDK